MRFEILSAQSYWELLDKLNEFFKKSPRYTLKCITVDNKSTYSYVAWLEIE